MADLTLLTEFTDSNSEISANAEFKGNLYFGMKNGQLWKFDGSSFSRIRTFTNPINVLYGDDSYLYIGFTTGDEFYFYTGSTFVDNRISQLPATTTTSISVESVAASQVQGKGTTIRWTFDNPVTAVNTSDSKVGVYEDAWYTATGATQISSTVIDLTFAASFITPTLWRIESGFSCFVTSSGYALLPQSGSITPLIQVLVTSVNSGTSIWTFNNTITAVDVLDTNVQARDQVTLVWGTIHNCFQNTANSVAVTYDGLTFAPDLWRIIGTPVCITVGSDYVIPLQSGVMV